MNPIDHMRPKTRSKARIWAGTRVYQLKRSLAWRFDGKRYARTKQEALLPYPVKAHRTPLLRQLKDVDMALQHNKIINLRLATKQLDKITLAPGETFSYWRLIGNPTRRKGYVDGMILHYGKVTTGTGGGLCQLSNLLYWITLHTPLTVTERYRHSYDVFPDSNRSQPFGSGATCAYNYLDLQIKNETETTYQLHLNLTDSDLIGEWRASLPPTRTYRIFEADPHFTREWWGGCLRHNEIHREVFNLAGDKIGEEFVTENHAIMMYEPFLTYDEQT
ncbi:VanW family protein [Exiguobacterium flavidum]|uniref:VanW family protein n=1 Tax=Exiguobacterium flavidum TaxID=2184695 RepID=UPI000DF738FA|nr:VanW family protein [Exiguobacterium flavidum]